jgi:hypothetical protein
MESGAALATRQLAGRITQDMLVGVAGGAGMVQLALLDPFGVQALLEFGRNWGRQGCKLTLIAYPGSRCLR